MSDKHQVGLSVTDFVDNGIRQKITSVTLQTANDQTITAGRYDGIDLYAFYVQHRIETADMVHHIVEIEEDWTKRLDIGNLFPLSNKNHGIISALYKRDKTTKKQTQAQLRGILKMHWEREGGIEKVLEGRR